MPPETVTLPLTGNGDSTTVVAVDDTPSGVVQLFKLLVGADGSTTFVPCDIDGLFVQSIDRAESPQDDLLVAANLAAGGNSDLNCADITTGKIGRLMAVDFGASVPMRCDIQTVSGGRVTRTVVYSNPGRSELWRAPAPTFIELTGAAGVRFGVSVTNLSPHLAADCRATVYWDEVTP